MKRSLRSAGKLALLVAGGATGVVGALAVAHAATAPAGSTSPSASSTNPLHVTGTVVEPENGKGWHKTGVTVHWTCTDDDPNAAVTSCPADQTFDQDGINDVTSVEATDDQGNHAAGTVVGIKIDHEAPETKIACSAPVYTDAATGKTWYGKGGPSVSVTAETDDIVPGVVSSGVAATYLDLDNASKKRIDSGSGDLSGVEVSSGAHVISAHAEDNAENVEISGNPHRKCLANIDGDNPAVNATRSAAPNANGWYNTPVTITYSCSDATTGVAACPATHTEATEGLDDAVYGTATDNTGNAGVEVEHLNIDMHGPSVGVSPDRGPNANGWYNGPVTMHTDCSDGLSGVDACDPDQVVDGEGSHSGSGHGKDRAGNASSSAFSLKIDKTAPVVTINGVSDGQSLTVGSTVSPSCTASDALSGLAAPCAGSLSKAITGVGTYTYTARATDLAGNTTVKTVTFKVVYGFNLQKPGANSQQSAGGVIQVVFAATSAQGKAIQTAATPLFASPLKGGALNQASTAGPFADVGAAGGSFTFDPRKGTYTFNWQTTKAMAGSWWQLRMQLDDGTIHTVIVGLK